jgi:hypothetical protein
MTCCMAVAAYLLPMMQKATLPVHAHGSCRTMTQATTWLINSSDLLELEACPRIAARDCQRILLADMLSSV